MTGIGKQNEQASSLPQLGPLSLLRAAWKNKYLTLGIWAVITAVSVSYVRTLPPVYEAEAMILIEGQEIPERYVEATVHLGLRERLNSVAQQLLSRTQLIEIIDEFGLYAEQRPTTTDERIVEKMRADIAIHVEQDYDSEQPGAFRVVYQGGNPEVVAEVTNRLANLLIAENERARQNQAVDTSQFLEVQLAEAKKELERQERQLSYYRRTHVGQLPEQEGALLSAIGNSRAQLQGLRDSINQAERDKLLLESSLKSAQQSLAVLKSGGTLPDVAETLPEPDSALEEAEARLRLFRAKYSPAHPDVKRAEAEVEALRAALSAGAGRNPLAATGTAPAPTSNIDPAVIAAQERVADIEARLTLTRQQIQSLQREHSEVVAEMRVDQGTLTTLPIREQELSSLTRDYAISRDYYQELLNKKLASDLASSMEANLKSERFVLLDAAKPPRAPVRPNRPLLMAMGSVFGLILGLAMGLGQEYRGNVVLGEWELPQAAALLGTVPHIEVEQESFWSRRSIRLGMSSALVVLLFLVLVLGNRTFGWI